VPQPLGHVGEAGVGELADSRHDAVDVRTAGDRSRDVLGSHEVERMIGEVTYVMSSTLFVTWLTAPSMLHAYAPCPCSDSQGETWSLITSKSKPARSAAAAYRTISRGPDCSVIRMYP
jgi:hypothetical protein